MDNHPRRRKTDLAGPRAFMWQGDGAEIQGVLNPWGCNRNATTTARLYVAGADGSILLVPDNNLDLGVI